MKPLKAGGEGCSPTGAAYTRMPRGEAIRTWVWCIPNLFGQDRGILLKACASWAWQWLNLLRCRTGENAGRLGKYVRTSFSRYGSEAGTRYLILQHNPSHISIFIPFYLFAELESHFHDVNPTTLLNNTYQVRAGVFFYATNKRDGSGLESHLSFLTSFQKCAASSAE